MSGMHSNVAAQVKQMWDTFCHQYPIFINHILGGVIADGVCFEYTCSSIRDVDSLREILRGMQIHLDAIARVFPDWENVRKDTMDHLNMYADELDIHRKHSNYALLSGSLAGVAGGALGIVGLLTAAPTGGASLALVVAGGTVSAGASVAYMGINKVTKSRVQEHVNKDEELTRQLARELQFLDAFIGRLGRWIDLTPLGAARQPLVNPDVAKCLGSATAAGFKLNSRTAGASTKCTKDVVETGSVALRNGAIVLIGVGIALDVAVIAYVSHDIHKGSKTATGKQLRKTALKLDHELREVRKIYQKIENEAERQGMQREIQSQRAEIAQLRAQLAARR